MLDTSALFSMEELPADSDAFVTPGVIKELERYKDRRASLWGELLHVSDPTNQPDEGKGGRVRDRRQHRLSPTDTEVMALALELEAEVLTDDYSVQNLATYLGIPFRPVGIKAIKEVRRWRWRCIGCGKVFDKEMPDCPICGSKLKCTLSKKN